MFSDSGVESDILDFNLPFQLFYMLRLNIHSRKVSWEGVGYKLYNYMFLGVLLLIISYCCLCMFPFNKYISVIPVLINYLLLLITIKYLICPIIRIPIHFTIFNAFYRQFSLSLFHLSNPPYSTIDIISVIPEHNNLIKDLTYTFSYD